MQHAAVRASSCHTAFFVGPATQIQFINCQKNCVFFHINTAHSSEFAHGRHVGPGSVDIQPRTTTTHCFSLQRHRTAQPSHWKVFGSVRVKAVVAELSIDVCAASLRLALIPFSEAFFRGFFVPPYKFTRFCFPLDFLMDELVRFM